MRRKKIYFDPFDDFLRVFSDGLVQGERGREESPWRPGVDIYEIEKGIIIVVELPGVKKENLEISLDEDYLIIEGRRYEPVYQFVKCHHRESLYGNFRRTIKLPRRIDEENIKAELREGLLLVYLPVREEETARIRID
ncbi:MAG: Hsp20 family protein [Deltaproteobacteria bacterium]|nr:Hsp20 family protein [Deltaproteobacteria bacterium]NIS76716.1 Hsp20 family protein [Deltaproteobacteria bacterium]